MSAHHSLIRLLAPAILLAAACSEPQVEEQDFEHRTDSASEVRQTLVVVKPLTVGPVRDEIVVTAKVAARTTVQVFPKLSGLPVTSVTVEEGDRVERDALLLTLYDTELRLAEQRSRATLDEARRNVEQARVSIEEAERRLVSTQRKAEQTRAEVQRLEGLGDLVSQKEVDDSRVAAESAEADRDLARLAVRGDQIRLALAQVAETKAKIDAESAQVNLSHTRIRSPMDGVVSFRDIDVGELSSVSGPAFRIVDLDDLILDLRAPQDAYRELAVGQPVEVRTMAAPRAEPFHGTVRTVNPVLDEQTGTAHVIVDLDSHPDLAPGLFCEARIITSHRAEALLVSKRAVLYEDEQPVIFAVTNGDSARRIPFVAGASTSSEIEILSDLTGDPLPPNLRVIVVGQESLKDGTPVKIVEDAF